MSISSRILFLLECLVKYRRRGVITCSSRRPRRAVATRTAAQRVLLGCGPGINRTSEADKHIALTEVHMHGRLMVSFVMLFGIMLAADVNQVAPGGLLSTLDHLVYATPELQIGIERIENVLGLRAMPGGQHPGRGTRNALVSLGPAMYLEIIGPDPEQPRPGQPRPFGIDDLNEPRLVTWAAKGQNLEYLASDAGRGGVKLGQVIEGSRRRADGVMLSWRYTDPRTVIASGIVPFFIDWGHTPHPASTATPGASLISLRAEHPDPEHVQKAVSRLGLDLRVQRGPRAALIATVSSPRGMIELR